MILCCTLASHVLGVNAKNHCLLESAWIKGTVSVLSFLSTDEARGIPGETF